MEAPVLEFADVCKRFPGSVRPTLNKLNLSCQREQISVLIGYSGTGKSVLLKHALGLLSPDTGRVRVCGQDLSELSDKQLVEIRSRFGMLFQSSALFDSLTVFDNVAFPLREHRRDWSAEKIHHRVMELLGLVGLQEAFGKMPSDISGGMKKRAALARTLALEPSILLFDEPTTGLDAVTAQTIDELIVETIRKLKGTALIVSHDLHAALRVGDVVHMLWEGEIVESAAPEVFKKSRHPAVEKFLKSAGVI